MARRGSGRADQSHEDMHAPDALDASDHAERELREGRYGGVGSDRPSAAEHVVGFLRPGKRWQGHARGWACERCGPTVHARTAAHKHDWWHRWLDSMFAAIGTDVEQLEGELEALREESAALAAEATERAHRAETQVAVLTRLLGPLLARSLDLDGDQGDQGETLVCRCAGAWNPDTPCPHCGRHGGPTHWDACHELAALGARP